MMTTGFKVQNDTSHRVHAVLVCLAVGLCICANAYAYAYESDNLLWFDRGRPHAEARQAVDILAGAAEDGLNALDYDATLLYQVVTAAADGPALPAEVAAQLDRRLTSAMLRYLRDLHHGRVDPRQIHANFAVPPPNEFDPAAHLNAALAEHRLPEAVRDAAPALPLYARLRQALATYRRLANDPVYDALWQTPLPSLPRRKLEPGQAYTGMPILTQRLLALGDLAAGTPAPARYEGAIIDAIKAFQTRHGLAQDGVLGRLTYEQLNVSPAARVRQIELNLERLRWTPLLRAPRMIVVNVPEFMLRAYEIRDGRIEVRAHMKVIVGKALDTRTPLLAEDMRFIEFSPYWNIPPSIAQEETIPRLRRDPDYFAQQGLEFVTTTGEALATLSSASLDAVMRGHLRIRQRPGPMNALGDIKFVFPNNEHIFLHHTPAPQLFRRERRDLSHGCIRVEDPVSLAKFVLRDDPEWDDERILAAMAAGVSSTLRLRTPLPVVIAYGTSLVKSDARVYFFPDIYGHDQLLDEALRRRDPNSPAGDAPQSAAEQETDAEADK